MGTWGFRPFQNDDVLDTFGYVRSAKELLKAIEKCFKHGAFFYTGYEVGAMLCDTFGITEYTYIKDVAREIPKILKGESASQDLRKKWGEATSAVAYACVFSTDMRRSLLLMCKDGLGKFIKACESDGEDPEMIGNMKEVYNNIVKVLNNFEYYKKNAICLTDRDIDKAHILVRRTEPKIKIECVEKIRGGQNKIIGYIIRDEQGNWKEFTPNDLKDLMGESHIECVNLKLTSDNRLINK